MPALQFYSTVLVKYGTYNQMNIQCVLEIKNIYYYKKEKYLNCTSNDTKYYANFIMPLRQIENEAQLLFLASHAVNRQSSQCTS